MRKLSFDKSRFATRMRDRPLQPQIVAGVQFKKIKVVKPHPAIRSVAEKGCCGKGVAGNVLQNDVCGKVELWKCGDCGKGVAKNVLRKDEIAENLS